jgi:hypothetical protein
MCVILLFPLQLHSTAVQMKHHVHLPISIWPLMARSISIFLPACLRRTLLRVGRCRTLLCVDIDCICPVVSELAPLSTSTHSMSIDVDNADNIGTACRNRALLCSSNLAGGRYDNPRCYLFLTSTFPGCRKCSHVTHDTNHARDLDSLTLSENGSGYWMAKISFDLAFRIC